MKVICPDGHTWVVEGTVLTRPGAMRCLSTTDLTMLTPAHLDGLQPAEAGWWTRKDREDR